MLVRRRIETSLEYGHPHLYQKSPPETILADVTMASMTGTLAQIGLVAHYASEMFTDLFTEGEAMRVRVSKLQDRAAAIVAQLPAVEEKVRKLDGNSGGAHSAREREERTRVQFNTETMPAFLKERYTSEAVERVPDFSELDALLPDKVAKTGPCVKGYSNPGFFLDQWAAEEMEGIAALQKKKAERKAERKERRKLQRLEGGAAASGGKGAVSTQGLNWRERYGMDGDEPRERSRVELDTGRPASLIADTRVGRSDSQQSIGSGSGDAPRPSSLLGALVKPKPPPPSKPPPPPPPKFGGGDDDDSLGSPSAARPSPPAVRRPPPPPKMTAPDASPESSPRAADAEPALSGLAQNAEYAKYAKMLKMGLPKGAVQQKIIADGLDPSILDDSDDEGDDKPAPRPAAPARPAAPRPPPPMQAATIAPVRPSMPMGGMGGLLGAIQQGAALKKAVVVKRDEPKNDLLAAIKLGGQLKKAVIVERAPEPKAAGGGGLMGREVDAILNLRQRVAADNDSSDDSDSDWDD
ncbi:hypothetical protein M885DRAFT_521631 [Pelagophyceae sp. CCMP2097]|nr:hypothetical protein M885DRAFT_521631 [Pelagophyceae sp. CCMP2097]